jgi:hypothetical protein
MDAITAARDGIGANFPPDPIAELQAHLLASNEPLLARKAELLGMEARLPGEITDEDWAEKITNAVKACTAFVKNSEAARVSAKEPHLQAERAVDGFFKKVSDPVGSLKDKMSKLLTAYDRRKADEERRRREAAAAEAARVAAEEARIAREEQARLAAIKRQEEEAKAAAARREEEARREAARTEQARQDAIRQAAEAKNREEREAAAAAQKKADEEAAAARKKADDERAAAQAEQDRLAAERAEQERIQKEARDRVAVAKQDANVALADSTVKAAELSRERTTLGAVRSLRTTWAFALEDLDLVPDTYLSLNEGAVRAAIKANTTKDNKCSLKIPGIRIYPVEDTQVR